MWLLIPKSIEKLALGTDICARNAELRRRLNAVPASEYLRFLIAVRRIVEARSSIERRINRLTRMLTTPKWRAFVSKHGGIGAIIEEFFPRVMYLAPGLDTPNRIAAASDKTLLLVKGIGSVKLNAIRERCARIRENRDADRIENVIR
jgi:hypothetical protein